MRGARSGAGRGLSRAGWTAILALVLLAAACGTSSDGRSEATTTSSGAGSTTSVDDAGEHLHDPTPDASLPPCPEEPSADPHSVAHAGGDGDGGDDHAPVDEASRDCRLPAAVQAELDPQLAVTRTILEQYPDAAAAQAGGYEVTEGNSHLVSWASMDDEFDVNHPEMLLLDDEGNTDQVVAAVYYVVTEDAVPPDGFAGTRDQWHPHTAICAAPATTEDGAQVACDDDGGERCEVTLTRSGPEGQCGDPVVGIDGWMLHVWVAPGHPSALGLFSAD